MGWFGSNKQWSTQARRQNRMRRARVAASYRNERNRRRRNWRHAIEHPISHAWSLLRTRNR